MLLVFVALCVSVAAQAPGGLTFVDVVVKDESGAAVTNLSRESFTVVEGAEPRDIHTFSSPDTPWNILLLFDHSLTWLQSDDNRPASPNYVVDAWRAMAQSIDGFIAHLKAHDRIAIAAFEDNVELLMDWRNAQSGKPLEVRLNAVVQPPKGLKDFYGAMEWAVTQLQGAKGRKAVILFTDGRDGRLSPQWFMNEKREEIFDPLFGLQDWGENEDFRRTSEVVRSSGVRFFFLTIIKNQPPDFGGRPVSGLFPGAVAAANDYGVKVQRRMERIAELSNGHVMYGMGAADAIAEYGRLYGDLMLGSMYTIEFSRGGSPEELQENIQVRLKEQNLRAQFLLHR
jgi:von Willebrand factor type A domain